MRYENLLFDLDGTITDPKEGITKSVQYALEQMGLPVDRVDKLEAFIGPPLRDSFREMYGVDDEGILVAIEHYRKRYEEKGIFEAKVHEGMADLLRDLHADGRRMAVATNKPWEFAERIVEHFGLAEYFTFVSGAELSGERGTKDLVVAWALEHLPGATGENTLMVGDHAIDVNGAREHAIETVGVLYGYGTNEEIEKAKPKHIAETVADLRAILMQ